MSIHALPQNAVRAIGASQVFADPTAVIKELLDNALDAQATSVFVEISSNTLDVLQVRDNGHGVPPEDRPLVAKRYCTSKIKDEDDLAAIGGSSLGFRGEALASAAEMSDTMTIITRVEGESVATLLKIAKDGSIFAQEPTSHAVGTTVRITGFLKAHPVRRQVALKNSQRYLTKIKQTLQAYAFTRSATRLSIRILKSPSSKDNWTFAGRVDSPIADTAFKIVGKPCASQCRPVTLNEDGFQLVSFLPQADADWSKVSSLGQFISVDDRPLSTSRGLIKQLVKIFREALKSRNNHVDGIKEPFMYLNIVCPPETYDANIEPAKDDVLFEDPDKVLNAARKLFASVYATEEPIEERFNEEIRAQLEDTPNIITEDSAVSRTTTNQRVAQAAEDHARPVLEKETPRFSSTMFELDEDLEHRPTLAHTPHEQADVVIEESSPSTRNITVSNPWVQAKINSLPKSGPRSLQAVTPLQDASSSIEPSPVRNQPNFNTSLPTPAPTSPVRPLPDQDCDRPTSFVGIPDWPAPEIYRQINQSDVAHQQSPQRLYQSENMPSSSPIRPQAQRAIASDTNHTQGTSLNDIPEAAPRRSSLRKNVQGRFVNKPSVPPVPKERDAWFDIPEARKSQYSKRTPKQSQVHRPFVPFEEERLGDNVLPARRPMTPSQNTDIRAFMGGQSASRETPVAQEVPTNDTLSVIPQPEQQPLLQGFVLASRLNVDDLEQENQMFKDAVPRTRRTKSGCRVLSSTTGNAATVAEIPDQSEEQSSKRPQRTKSSMLPLERVPIKAQMQNVSIKPAVTKHDIERRISRLNEERTFIGWNEPALGPCDGFAETDQTLLLDWTMRLELLLRKRWPDGEVIGDIGRTLEQALPREEDVESIADSEMFL